MHPADTHPEFVALETSLCSLSKPICRTSASQRFCMEMSAILPTQLAGAEGGYGY